MLSLGILGSGRGSNARSILEYIEAGRLDARAACVVSDVAGSGILELGRMHGIPSFHVDGAPFRTKLDGAAQDQVIGLLREHGVDTVALAGFMRMVKPALLRAFPGRVVNIHPALLPAFPGLEAWEQALAAGASESGCTVHFVDEGMDTGPVILQRRVPVLPDDTPASLHARIQEQEHLAYPEALALLASGRVRLEGGKVVRS
ncbi:MAG TPA: phosphoribosylglycinamide formyltransferase [Kiritimatiellia bacterium]|nr:phosphoribosylglycinamide formyltransferase [Kiritimatiellia bacterium]HRZ11821.1 phosphoribosylglycinamide formyltransferase [Kiritimatiellia bacterium]HSA17373.1 phosphoribosylglycinamide formyltransferase [Kiritimatiellia bacterium]